ncbi:hypothetical protein ACS0TY_027360 [Phlomoides rotata]
MIMTRIGDDYQAELTQLIMPRIGDEYQVELPELPSTDEETKADHDLHFLVGLPVLITSSRTRLDLNRSDQGDQLVPGVDEEDWSEAERDCFLLGLYIFEKDFVWVRRFVETKKMGAILSYYYRKFHSSSEYCRWCDCRKMKSLRRRMFSGSRKQEVVSRMLPRLEEERRKALLDVSTLFGDGKMSLVDYVVSLKAIVGLDILLEAVGLGKGRQDLVSKALEKSRFSRVTRVLPDCSSLSPLEIIEFLKKDRRLSKARSSDLFWNAVWPRLRARGWHSEQPGNLGYGGKGSLVFLTPGIKKFCRKNLVKGDQYFDSVTEVLSIVAQDPGLIGGLNSEVEPRPQDTSSTCPSASSAGCGRSDSSENPRPRELFDLNLPYSDSEDIASQEAEDRHRTLDLENGADVNQRRHSTRTRPPSVRLIYQATCGYDTVVRRSNKRKEASADDDQSRLSQRVLARSTQGAETGASGNEGGDSKQ